MSIRRSHLPSALLAGAALFAAVPCHAVLIDTFDPPNAAVTSTQSGSAPGAALQLLGPTGNFLRLVNDGINSQNNTYSYHRTDVGAFSRVVSSFNFRAAGAGDNADGFAMLLLPTSVYGVSGTGPLGISWEEPNVANTFAAGFDLYPPVGTNDVSVHFNGTERQNINIPEVFHQLDNNVFHRGVVTLQHVAAGAYATIEITSDINGAGALKYTSLSTFIPGLAPYENRVQFSARTGGADMNVDLDNINVSYSNAPLPGSTVNNFDTPGTPMHFTQGGTGPGPGILPGGPSGSFLRLAHDQGSHENRAAFAATADGLDPLKSHVRAKFDFRLTDGPGAGRADGFSMMLLPTAFYGTDGVGVNPPAHEEPNLLGVIALGFDVYPTQNDVSLHFGAEIVNIDLNPAAMNLSNGQFNSAQLDLVESGGQVFASLILTPNGGPSVTAFSNVLIPGLAELYNYRVQFGARTGGETFLLDIDNVNVANVVPEPASAMLGLLGLGALALRRRRVA